MPKKILVVDDEPNIREIIRFYLEDEGYQVLEASRGEEVFDSVKKNQPDLITLDIILPGIDGFEVIKILKNDPQTSSIPIIILSVLADKRNYKQGIADYICKPFKREELLSAVNRVFEQLEKEKKLRKKILVVDDEPDIIDIIVIYLKDAGFDTLKASDGEEAIIKTKQEYPDLIILDLKMPKMSGFEVIKILKQDKSCWQIPIIVLTGTYLTSQDREHVLNLGATKYLYKPFNAEELIKEIKELICARES